MINVPPGARPGDQLAIPLQDGTSLTITVPEGSKPGDSLRFSTGGSQTAAPPPKTPDTVEVTVPPGARPGDELSIPLPDGTSIKITVPPGARPGDDLEIPTAGGAPAPTCVEIKILRRVRVESSRPPPRHRRDACSMAWRCRFLTARRNQRGHVTAEK